MSCSCDDGRKSLVGGNSLLRFIFSAQDLARTRVAAEPAPLWEIVMSLHRLQSRTGRWAFADWHHRTRTALESSGLRRAVREALVPLVPRASYFPDFLTPPGDLRTGLASIHATPGPRVRAELRKLAGTNHMPDWMRHLPDPRPRQDLTDLLVAYHETAVRPWEPTAQAAVDADRAFRARALLDGGTDSLLHSFRPHVRWTPPVLEIAAHPGNREVHLKGRGLLLVPSYFCRGAPVALADPAMEQVLVYAVAPTAPPEPATAPLATLLGRTRARVLRTVAGGTTTGELSRIVGISPATASHHVTALRDAGLVTSTRHANTVLHTLTPLGAALLTASAPRGPEPVAAPRLSP